MIKLGDFVNKNNLGEVGAEKVMIALTRNDYEPDISFFSKEKASKFTDDQMLFPAPDFVVETEYLNTGLLMLKKK